MSSLSRPRLMGGAQQVVDGLDRCEGRLRYLDEYRQPARHGAVPESGALERLDLATVLRLAGDEDGGGIDVALEVERAAAGIAHGAGEKDGIEVGRVGEGGPLRRV